MSGGSSRISSSAPISIAVSGSQLSWVEQFKYLGSQFSSSGSIDAELKYRMQQAAAAFAQLRKGLFGQRCVAICTKMQAYKAVVAAVLLYGSHSWALSADQLERLEVLHRQHLRCILGVRRSDHLHKE